IFMSLNTKSFGAGTALLGISGPGIMLLGMLMFSLNDVMGKWLVASYGVGQIILIRSVAALCMLAPFIWQAGLQPILNAEKPALQIARLFSSTFEVFAFYYAVMYLPLADVMTYWLAAPIYVAAASPLLLGEKVGWRRWLAIAVGFVGVIIALNPSKTMFTTPALISLAGPMAFALMFISSRQLLNSPDRSLALFQLLGALIAGLVFSPFDWVPVASANEWFLMLLLGIVA